MGQRPARSRLCWNRFFVNARTCVSLCNSSNQLTQLYRGQSRDGHHQSSIWTTNKNKVVGVTRLRSGPAGRFSWMAIARASARGLVWLLAICYVGSTFHLSLADAILSHFLHPEILLLIRRTFLLSLRAGRCCCFSLNSLEGVSLL